MHNPAKLRKVLQAMNKLGFSMLRQKGSHAFFEHPDGRTTTIPMHDEINYRLLLKIVRKDLKMPMDKFQNLM